MSRVTIPELTGKWGNPANVMWDQEDMEGTVACFCGADMIGCVTGYLPHPHNTAANRERLYAKMYEHIKSRAGRGVRLVMADRLDADYTELRVRGFAEYLAKHWPGQMVSTRQARNPRSNNPTKMWIFRIP